MASFIGLVQRLYKVFHVHIFGLCLLTSPFQVTNPPATPKDKPIRFGVLGAAAIAPQAIIVPARSHPEVVVYAVAARSLERAQKFARKHGVEKAYGGPHGYQGAYSNYWVIESKKLRIATLELLDDPNVDAVYNPVCLHCIRSHKRWTNP